MWRELVSFAKILFNEHKIADAYKIWKKLLADGSWMFSAVFSSSVLEGLISGTTNERSKTLHPTLLLKFFTEILNRRML
jgi:hypothetical protein